MRSILSPALSIGTSTIDCRLWSAAERSVFSASVRSASVRPIKIATLQRESPAPEDHHLRPLMTYSAPCRTILASLFIASDVATPGPVIAKHDRIAPTSRDFRQRSSCSPEPYEATTSILPVAGAEQLDTS